MSGTILFRPLEPDDFAQLRGLHEEFFPIRYADNFYIDACNGIGLNGDSLFSEVVVQDNEMIAFVLAQFIPMDGTEDREVIESSGSSFDSLFYILTLGVKKEFRRNGISSKLIAHCCDHAAARPTCGAIYLHVIDYNKSAIAFYEKNRFLFFKEIEDFYLIGKEYYSSYLYVCYINNAKPPLFHHISFSLRALAGSSLAYLYSWLPSWIAPTNKVDIDRPLPLPTPVDMLASTSRPPVIDDTNA